MAALATLLSKWINYKCYVRVIPPPDQFPTRALDFHWPLRERIVTAQLPRYDILLGISAPRENTWYSERRRTRRKCEGERADDVDRAYLAWSSFSFRETIFEKRCQSISIASYKLKCAKCK